MQSTVFSVVVSTQHSTLNTQHSPRWLWVEDGPDKLALARVKTRAQADGHNHVGACLDYVRATEEGVALVPVFMEVGGAVVAVGRDGSLGHRHGLACGEATENEGEVTGAFCCAGARTSGQGG